MRQHIHKVHLKMRQNAFTHLLVIAYFILDLRSLQYFEINRGRIIR